MLETGLHPPVVAAQITATTRAGEDPPDGVDRAHTENEVAQIAGERNRPAGRMIGDSPVLEIAGGHAAASDGARAFTANCVSKAVPRRKALIPPPTTPTRPPCVTGPCVELTTVQYAISPVGARADALFELGDAVLCAGGPVTSLVELCQEKRFRRGHGALYDGLASGQLDSVAVGRLLACSWDPVDAGPVKVAVDVSTWPRPDAETSPERCHCYHSCRCDGARKTIPGWPYSIAAGLSWGASSRPRRWTRSGWVPTTTPPSPACSRSSEW